MNIPKSNINHLTFLSGFHLHKPDYNFKEVSGKLINEIDEILNVEFQKIDVDNNLILLKSKTNKYFDIQLHSDKLIYEDSTIDFKEFQAKSFSIFEAWQKLSERAKKPRLVGTRRRFQILLEESKSKYHSFLLDNYIKNAEFDGEKKQTLFLVNSIKSHKGDDYNINLNFNEIYGEDHILEIHIDINRVDNEKIGLLTSDKISQIYNYSEFYYDNELFKNIKIDII